MVENETTTERSQYKTIFSMSLAMALIKKGHQPIYVMPNPHNRELNCWVFDTVEDETFMNDFLALKKS